MIDLSGVSHCAQEASWGSEGSTHELSEMDRILGAYCDVGRDDFGEGAPKPAMPETLCRLLRGTGGGGREGIGDAPFMA